MEFKLLLLILGSGIVCSRMNEQQDLTQSDRNYYGQPTIKLIVRDPDILQRLKQMNRRELQYIVYKKILPYFREFNILPLIEFEVRIEGKEIKDENNLRNSRFLPNIELSPLTITPIASIIQGPYLPKQLMIGEIKKYNPDTWTQIYDLHFPPTTTSGQFENPNYYFSPMINEEQTGFFNIAFNH